MNEYILQINLSFNTESEAKDIMAICEPLVLHSSEESKGLLINAVEGQSQKIKDIKFSLAQKLELTEDGFGKLLENASIYKRQLSELLESSIGQVKEFDENINKVLTRGNQMVADIQQLLEQANKMWNELQSDLKEFNEVKKQAESLQEAINFLLDMKDVTNNIVTKGSVKLLERQDGEMKPVDGWQFERK